MKNEEIEELEKKIDQKFEEIHAHIAGYRKRLQDGSIDDVKEFSRKLTVFNREVGKMIKSLKQ